MFILKFGIEYLKKKEVVEPKLKAKLVLLRSRFMSCFMGVSNDGTNKNNKGCPPGTEP